MNPEIFKNIYVGIDPSLTSTGLVILNENNDILLQKLISRDNKYSIEDRILLIVSDILNELPKYYTERVLVNIEGLSFSSKGQTLCELSGLQYYLRIELNKLDIKYIITPPTVLKKFITGKGNSKKNLMLLYCYKKFGIEFTDDNLCDAYSLSRFLSK